jgi:hypothetical protein
VQAECKLKQAAYKLLLLLLLLLLLIMMFC